MSQVTPNAPTDNAVEGDLNDRVIRSQLASVLASPEFKGKATLSSFLRFVVEQTLAGNGHQIKGYTIATQVLGRADNFDAVRDPTVRVLAGKLRAAFEHYYLTSGRHDPVQTVVPKGTYVPAFHRQPVHGSVNALSSYDEPDEVKVPMPAEPGIAVMPLSNLTGDPEQEYFVDGLTEELVAEIARYQDLRVVASQSTLQMKGVGIGARDLGRVLNIRFFLEGSVRRDGSCFKISVRLIDTSTQMQIWGEQFRRVFTVGNLIQLQEEIASRVAARIGGLYGVILQKLTKESRGQTPKALETYEALLRLHQYSMTLTKETFLQTLEALEYARQCDPELGVVWSMLAVLYADSNTVWLAEPEVSMETALAYARKGASLEPQNQYVRTMLAYLHFLVSDRDAFLQEAERAIELNPNSPMHTAFMGWALALYGEWDRGRFLLEKAIELNPYYPGWFRLVPFLYAYQAGRYEEAHDEAARIHLPELFWDPLLRAAALGQMGKTNEAQKAGRSLLDVRPDFPAGARRLLAFFVKTDALIDGILDGLRKAGVRITSETASA